MTSFNYQMYPIEIRFDYRELRMVYFLFTGSIRKKVYSVDEAILK